MSELIRARELLGMKLRQLRRDAAMTVRDLADACAWPPSKVSLLEEGRQLPSALDITTWTTVTSSQHAVADLREQLVFLESSFRGWQRQSGYTSQRRWADSESQARHLRVFEPHFVIGLLQSPEYARRRLEAHARFHHATDDIDRAVTMRMQRQEILQRDGMRFDFLLTEFGLRSKAYATRDIMADQIRRVIQTTPNEKIRLGVIPIDAEWGVNVDHGFWIFDTSHVVVETVTAELKLNQPGEIDTYARVFKQLAGKALHDDQAQRLLMDVLTDLS